MSNPLFCVHAVSSARKNFALTFALGTSLEKVTIRKDSGQWCSQEVLWIQSNVWMLATLAAKTWLRETT